MLSMRSSCRSSHNETTNVHDLIVGTHEPYRRIRAIAPEQEASQAIMGGENLPLVGVLKNPIFVRSAIDGRRRQSFGSQFGVYGRNGRTVGFSRRFEVPGWPPGWQEERWPAV